VQTRRHAHIVALLGVSNIILAVNKMDRIGYDKAKYEAIAGEFAAYAHKLGVSNVEVIPCSALHGVNVVARGTKETPWYTGRTLLEALEGIEVGRAEGLKELRFPIQLVSRPDANFRGYAGTVASGEIGVGDGVLALPSRKSSKKPNATLLFPAFRRTAHRRNSFAALPRPNTVSSPASDLPVDPRKLLASARHQTANVRFFQRQSVGDLAIREPLLFEQQAAPHRLLDFVQRPASFFDCLAALVVLFRSIDIEAVFHGALVIFVVANHRAVLPPHGVSRHVKSHAQQPRAKQILARRSVEIAIES